MSLPSSIIFRIFKIVTCFPYRINHVSLELIDEVTDLSFVVGIGLHKEVIMNTQRNEDGKMVTGQSF